MLLSSNIYNESYYYPFINVNEFGKKLQFQFDRIKLLFQ